MKNIAAILLLCLWNIPTWSQETIKGFYEPKIQRLAQKDITHTVQLPFKEDFSKPILKEEWWSYNNGVYINNHLANNMPSHGIATFDATNTYYQPYDSIDRDHTTWGDSLITSYIDLSQETVDSHVILSFYYQAKGNGYMPKVADSFYVFFKNKNGLWDKKIALAPRDTNIFLQEWLPINDTSYFHEEFQILFSNKATLGFTNSHWHLDYIEVDRNRNIQSYKNDIAIQTALHTTLRDYGVITWHKYKNNSASLTNPSFSFNVNNLSNQNINTQAHYTVTDQYSNLIYSTNITLQLLPMSVGGYSFNNPPYPTTIDADSVYFTHQIVIDDPYGNSSNDTLRHIQKFENQVGYDDGSAELAYYLLMHPSFYIPAQTALAFDFNTSDTIRGFGIHLPKGTIGQERKDFSIRIYEDINTGFGQDPYIYEATFLMPKYDTTNPYGFVYYVFDEPVIIPRNETYYFTVIQPTGGASDSFYIGLDINLNSSQKRFFNIDGNWEPSEIGGSLLVRPLIGKDISYLSTPDISALEKLIIYPNPSKDWLHIGTNQLIDYYVIYNTMGTMLQSGSIRQDKINIKNLSAGNYLLVLKSKHQIYPALKFIKE